MAATIITQYGGRNYGRARYRVLHKNGFKINLMILKTLLREFLMFL